MPVQIAEAEVTELQGKGIDVLAKHVIEGSPAKSASNDPADAEAEAKAKADTKADDAKAAEAAKAKDAKPKVDDGMQKRMNELTKQARTAERTAQAERDARIKAEQERDAAREQATKNAPKPEAPKREDFEDTDAYVDALADFKVEQKLAERDVKRAEQATKERAERDAADKRKSDQAAAEANAEEISKRFTVQVEEARKKHEDFDAVTGSDAVMLKPSLATALLTSDVGGELMYHLGKHPEDAERLNGLDQASMLKELGKIELNLTEKPAGDGAGDQPRGPNGKFVKADEISQASEPIKPVRAGAEGSSVKDPEAMSVAEHREAAFRASRSR